MNNGKRNKAYLPKKAVHILLRYSSVALVPYIDKLLGYGL